MVDEVIIEALRLLEERDSHDQQWLEETCDKVVVGLEQLELLRNACRRNCD